MKEYPKNMGIKTWAEEDRPREKLLEKGKAVLTNAELVAILINSGNREDTAVTLSKKILQSVNNDLQQLGKLNVKELCRFNGIGEAKAVSIVAALELGRRRQAKAVQQKDYIIDSRSIFELFQPILADLPHEEFWLMCLNNANRVIMKERISSGGVSATIVDIPMILRKALEALASYIVVVHNHPSGSLVPSHDDRRMTKKLREASRIMDMPLLDHVIVTDSGFFSFADKSLL